MILDVENPKEEDYFDRLNRSKYNVSFMVLNFVIPLVGLDLLTAEILTTNTSIYYKSSCFESHQNLGPSPPILSTYLHNENSCLVWNSENNTILALYSPPSFEVPVVFNVALGLLLFSSICAIFFSLFMLDFHKFNSRFHHQIGRCLSFPFGQNSGVQQRIVRAGDRVGLRLLNVVMVSMMISEIAVLSALMYILLLYPRYAQEIAGNTLYLLIGTFFSTLSAFVLNLFGYGEVEMYEDFHGLLLTRPDSTGKLKRWCTCSQYPQTVVYEVVSVQFMYLLSLSLGVSLFLLPGIIQP